MSDLHAALERPVTDALRHGLLDQPTGHDPSVCTDLLCPCAHKPIKPKEDRCAPTSSR